MPILVCFRLETPQFIRNAARSPLVQFAQDQNRDAAARRRERRKHARVVLRVVAERKWFDAFEERGYLDPFTARLPRRRVRGDRDLPHGFGHLAEASARQSPLSGALLGARNDTDGRLHAFYNLLKIVTPVLRRTN
jgi:hypothetical protein